MSMRFIIMCLCFAVVTAILGVTLLSYDDIAIGCITLAVSCFHLFSAWEEIHRNSETGK